MAVCRQVSLNEFVMRSNQISEVTKNLIDYTIKVNYTNKMARRLLFNSLSYFFNVSSGHILFQSWMALIMDLILDMVPRLGSTLFVCFANDFCFSSRLSETTRARVNVGKDDLRAYLIFSLVSWPCLTLTQIFTEVHNLSLKWRPDFTEFPFDPANKMISSDPKISEKICQNLVSIRLKPHSSSIIL